MYSAQPDYFGSHNRFWPCAFAQVKSGFPTTYFVNRHALRTPLTPHQPAAPSESLSSRLLFKKCHLSTRAPFPSLRPVSFGKLLHTPQGKQGHTSNFCRPNHRSDNWLRSYCEENIYLILRDHVDPSQVDQYTAVFISNPQSMCPLDSRNPIC